MKLKPPSGFLCLFLLLGLFSITFITSAQESPAAEDAAAALTDNKPAELTAPKKAPSPIILQAALSHSYYNDFSAKNLLLKVDFTAAPATDNQRPPLNIALVLDRSKSMENEQKFAYTLDAARAVIENLSPRDVISIITFNEQAVVLSPAGKVVNKAFLNHRLDEISPGGVTDISAGLLEGIAQIKSQAEEGQIQHVLLLTDGKANRGILDPEAMRNIAATAHAGGISVSTLGCSSEFNEERLKLLAKAGGGRYRYVRSAEELPTAFKEELQGMLQVSAQNVRLQITLSKGNRIRKIYGRFLPQPQSSYEIKIGNLRAGERGGLLLALQPDGFKAGDEILVTTEITFDNPDTVERTSQTINNKATFSSELDVEKQGINQEVIHYGEVLAAMETAREAVESFDIDRYKKAQAGFVQSYNKARQYALAAGNQDLLNQTFLLKHFMQELEAARTEGKMHSHEKMNKQLHKEADYQRYLLFHHKARQQAPSKHGETKHEHSK